MSCISALHSQIATLVSMPHEVLFLRHRVFHEYVKIAVGPDFIHTLPSFLILAAALLLFWKNPPSFQWLMNLVMSFIYKGFQVSISCLAINALLWLWLVLQRILYCSVWRYWSYESEYQDISYPWWHRVWSSYYPAPVQPPVMSASFISWLIAMFIATITLGCTIYTNHIKTLIKKIPIKFRNALSVVNFFTEWMRNRVQHIFVNSETNVVMDDGEISSICDDGHSETSIDANCAAQGDVHPISYGTNWVPQPNFSLVKETQRKLSMKSFHTVTGMNDIQDSDKFVAKQLRHRRGCYTVIPSNSSEKSSEC